MVNYSYKPTELLMHPNYSSGLIRDLYLQDEGITISPYHERSNIFQIIWKRFHAQHCGIQLWASMKHPRPVDTILHRYKSEKTINNFFNYWGGQFAKFNAVLQIPQSTHSHLFKYYKGEILNAIYFDSVAFWTVMADCDSFFDELLLPILWNNYR
jgi:hypothetical protein